MSLDRLINLAKRTGDRLIVHDALSGRDIVIMGIDAYEDLVFSPEVLDDHFSTMDDDTDLDDTSEARLPNDWHSAGSVLSDRYRDWQDSDEQSGVSLVDDMWAPAKAEQKAEKTPTEAGSDGGDEPVFYEEPVG